jgi:glycosyltransferase involved in cell wall biosynthesis
VFKAGGDVQSVADNLKIIPRGVLAVRAAAVELGADWIIANSLTAGVWAVLAARTMGRRRPRVAVITRDYGWWCPTHVCRVVHGAPWRDCGTVRFARTCSFETMQRYATKRSGMSYWLALMGRWFNARLTARAGRMADLRFANSADLAARWLEREGSDGVVLGSGVPVHELKAPRPPEGQGDGDGDGRREPFTVALMTRGSPGKGAHLVVEAARQLNVDGSWRFVAYGSPGDVDESGVVDRHEPLKHDDALAAMAAADLVVVPSVYPEALPRTAIEAQLMGTPVVGTPGAGTPEAIAPSGGVVATRTDSSALAAALREARQRLETNGFDMPAARAWLEARHGISVVRARFLDRLES